jgi:hypothetical protein
MEALLQLGEIHKRTRNFGEAQGFYEDAKALAEQQEELAVLKRVNCVLGVCKAEVLMEDHFSKLKSRARASRV